MQRSNLVIKDDVTLQEMTEETDCYEQVLTHFEKNNCWGILSSLDVKNCKPELVRSAEAIKNYVLELCDLIQMRRFQDTMIVNFGEDERVAGYSMVQLIETSLISGHFANLTNQVFIDIFSCKIYDPYKAAEFTKRFFGGSDVAVKICFRG